MEDEDHEMRQILYSFGFAAHEHVARAEKLLAHPSTESVEHLVADSEIRRRIQYLRMLPNLINQARTLDQKTLAAYRMWRQALGQPNSERHRTEFRKLDGELQQILSRFCYRAKAIQEMSATAQSIAAKFRASQRVLQQARRCRDSVCQMPVLDVERQTIEAMEEFVRMPCELFLRNCARLKTAETRFQQARCEMIQGHLPLVASIAATYSNQGHTLPELIRGGIFGLIRAVDKFGYRREWKFSAYAAGSIRQGVRDALAAQPRQVPRPVPSAVGEGDNGSSESV
jgi:RNA polymerase primary sigma factor